MHVRVRRDNFAPRWARQDVFGIPVVYPRGNGVQRGCESCCRYLSTPSCVIQTLQTVQQYCTAAIYHETEIRWPAAGVFISMVVPLLGDERSTHFGTRQKLLYCVELNKSPSYYVRMYLRFERLPQQAAHQW